MGVSNKKVSTSVTISFEKWQWVKDHPQYTFSGLLEWAIEQHMQLELDIGLGIGNNKKREF